MTKERKASIPTAVIYILYNKESQQILFEQRTDPSSDGHGKLVFPGGKVEIGESIFSAVEREIEEEIGIKTEDTVLIGVFTAKNLSAKNIRIFAFLAISTSNVIEDPEGRNERKWISLEEAEKKIEVDTTIRMFGKLKAVLGYGF